jgi:hypothetical protein
MITILRLAIYDNDKLSHRNKEYNTPFVIYQRESYRGIDVLFFSCFKNPENAYPIRYFVPYLKKQFGHFNAIWQTFSNIDDAQKYINMVTKRINEHMESNS